MAIGLLSVLDATSKSVTAEQRYSLSAHVELWGMQEITLNCARVPVNPFADVDLEATFTNDDRAVTVDGFHDGSSTWRIRFMPDREGEWSFQTKSSEPSMDGRSGSFSVGPSSPGNHGPVGVANTYHFSYADGTPYFLLGTTSYNWLNRDDALQERSLTTLRAKPFNKLRFGLFPKWFVFNRAEPSIFPYLRKEEGSFDLERFDPRFFAKVETRIRQLDELGLQADIILFHPYDKWGFATMGEDQNLAYLRYVVARLAAFRNVWWTMANEYDLMESRDWDKLVRVVHSCDPYKHPIGNHPIMDWYDPTNPLITHVILQSGTTAALSVKLARSLYGKPVVDEEYGYEGNNTMGWGDLKSNEAVLRHWEITLAGGYASHGDTHVHPGGIQFWAAGGEMGGESPARLGFLKEVMSGLPYQKMVPSPELVAGGEALAKEGEAYLFSFFAVEGLLEPRKPTQVRLTGAELFKVESIDPWSMRIYELGYTAPGDHAFSLLMKPSLLRITAVPTGDFEAESLSTLLDRFAGEPSEPQEIDPALFEAAPLQFSVEFPIAQLLLNPDARAVLEKYLPPKAFEFPARAFPLKVCIEKKMIGEEFAERIPRIDAELRAIPLE